MFKRFWWMFLVMLPAGAFAGFVVAAVFTYVMPKMYESEAVIEVRPRSSPVESAERPMETGSRFLDTARETIVSRNSLEKVVDALELANRWNMDRETAAQVLKSAVVTENIRGTNLLSIRVRLTNKVDARDIAAEVVAVSASSASETVVIHENPVISDSPVSPNVSLNLLLGTAFGILLSPLMAVLLIWVMDRLMPTKLVDV